MSLKSSFSLIRFVKKLAQPSSDDFSTKRPLYDHDFPNWIGLTSLQGTRMAATYRTILRIFMRAIGILKPILVPPTGVREIVMAKVIEFYTPKNFRKPLRWTPQPQHGKVIEFCMQTKKSA